MAEQTTEQTAAQLLPEAAGDGFEGDNESLLQPALGQGLRRLRRSRGLSLAEAARATGLSSSFLSLVEKGNSDIAIGRLMRVMRVYGASIGDLDTRAPRAGDDPVVRKGQGKHIRSQEGIDLYLLAPDTNRMMMPVTTTYAPRARQTNLHPHDGQTFLYVLEGTLLLELEGHAPAVLNPGDSAYYQAQPGADPLQPRRHATAFIGVVTPPTL